jgi:hypothetical protein
VFDEDSCCFYWGFAAGRDSDRGGTDIAAAKSGCARGGVSEAYADHSSGNDDSTIAEAGNFDEDS